MNTIKTVPKVHTTVIEYAVKYSLPKRILITGFPKNKMKTVIKVDIKTPNLQAFATSSFSFPETNFPNNISRIASGIKSAFSAKPTPVEYIPT